MKWIGLGSQGEPGFRLNLIDLGFIGLIAAASVIIRLLIPNTTIYLIPPYVVFTFFLFCNVFRIGILLELFWVIPFAAVAFLTLPVNDLGLFWALVLLVLEPLKWILIAIRVLRGPYAEAGHAQVTRWKEDRRR